MYTVAVSTSERAQFKRIWSQVWSEMGYEQMEEDSESSKLLVQNEDEAYIGIIEIKPYRSANLELNQVALFHQQPELVGSMEKAAEVSKVAMLSEHRGANLSRILSALVYYADRHLLDYYVGLVEPAFARALRITYKVPMRAIQGRMWHKGREVIPMMIHVGRVRRDKHDYKWILANEQKTMLESY